MGHVKVSLAENRETWEKKNVTFHDNDTVTFYQEKIYHFDESQSVGSEDDVVVVPNIPMLVSVSSEKNGKPHRNPFGQDAMWQLAKACGL
ncbi:hypothetical protein HUJ05_006944 [Dendroctonus ponderosae]|nr:hypothetical protein HUJ05_006944 [Dendroctonus ponderosae]